MKPLRSSSLLAAFVSAAALLAAPACQPEEELRLTPVTAAPLWADHCARCHGPDGRGAPLGQLMGTPDLGSAALQDRLTDPQLVDVIERGKGKMPPFAAALSRPKMQLLAGFVRGMRRAGP